ncbi:Protein kinase-like domain [Pseudocohnilembus persalinus]|uniref:Protein kinase-like domain n=1 Tax=Pseudocohnilembus persalinus TaxID=266149 RepID=A0A0V0QU67_PSEPJ|nr:Protein kinase-like domain [Pseudocohnilembus persalinus]|eukprot:KRX05552.1 Protein kinase-like domain [Pseudocohnilembus persalinus]
MQSSSSQQNYEQKIIYNENAIAIIDISETQIVKLSQHTIGKPDECKKNCYRLENENFYQLTSLEEHILPHAGQVQKNQQFLNFQGCYVVMEKASSDFFQFIKTSNLQLAELKTLAKQVCLSIKSIHDKNIAHNDIKLDNFFYYEQNNSVKIGDFGYSSQSQLDNFTQIQNIFKNKNSCLLSPELKEIKESRHQLLIDQFSIDLKKSDVYNLGLLLLEMSYKISMKNLQTKRQRRYFLTNKEQKFTETEITRFFHPIINNCLHQDPSERFNIEQVLKYFTE